MAGLPELIPFPRWRCSCGYGAASDAELEAHYDRVHPALEDIRHPEHETFIRWRRVHIGR